MFLKRKKKQQHKHIPFVNKKSDVPIVEFMLTDGTSLFALVDTGADSCLFDSNFVKTHKKNFVVTCTDSKVELIGVSTSNSTPVINAEAMMILPEESQPYFCSVSGMVLPLGHLTEHLESVGEKISVSALIGSDFLIQNGIKLNFETKEMIIHDDISRQ